ncbi:MAG: sigma-70 family RNA polymerase sigma factor [Actinomycetota bacterium]|nr:sigma-70 family RNA polymerase sigma factor [Actinomycetota bacterium]
MTTATLDRQRQRQTNDLGHRFARRDPDAVREVHARFAGPLHATARRVLGDRELASEATQRALLAAWKAAPRFDPERALEPWLHTIVRRAAIDVHRQHRRHLAGLRVADQPEPEPVVHVSFDHGWVASEVREALARIPADERRILELAHFGGHTYAEVAAQLDIPIGTVKTRAFRAHRRLRGLLAHVMEPAA